MKKVLNNDGDDIVQLKKIAQLIEDGSKKIGKKLSKNELKAGQNSKLARLVSELYRPTATVGDGETADMLVYEFYTGESRH